MPGKGMLPSLSRDAMVNMMWSSIWFMWLNRMSTWYHLTMQITLSTYLLHQGVGMGNRAPSANSLKYSIYLLAITRETGDPMAALWGYFVELLLKRKHIVI